MNGQRQKNLLMLITGLALAFVFGWFLRGSLYHDEILVETEKKITESRLEISSVEESSPAPSPEVSQVEKEMAVAKRPEPSAKDLSSVEETESAGTDSRRIDLNLATAVELQTLPGIGEVLAQRIIDYREESGGFQFVEELMDIKGIGEKTFKKIAEYVEVR